MARSARSRALSRLDLPTLGAPDDDATHAITRHAPLLRARQQVRHGRGGGGDGRADGGDLRRRNFFLGEVDAGLDGGQGAHDSHAGRLHAL